MVSTQAGVGTREQRRAGLQLLEARRPAAPMTAPAGVTYRALTACQPLLQAPASGSWHNPAWGGEGRLISPILQMAKLRPREISPKVISSQAHLTLQPDHGFPNSEVIRKPTEFF